jgi:hypothetical protein
MTVSHHSQVQLYILINSNSSRRQTCFRIRKRQSSSQIKSNIIMTGHHHSQVQLYIVINSNSSRRQCKVSVTLHIEKADIICNISTCHLMSNYQWWWPCFVRRFILIIFVAWWILSVQLHHETLHLHPEIPHKAIHTQHSPFDQRSTSTVTFACKLSFSAAINQ